ncbi:MAG: vWA domain-containing protein [Pseudomonadota bacterium]
MRDRRRRDGERGATTVLGVAIILVVAITAAGSATVGMVASKRADVQRAADSAAMLAVSIFKEMGLPDGAAKKAAAAAAAGANSSTPVVVNCQWRDNDAALTFEVQCTAQSSVASFFDGDSYAVQAVSTAAVQQRKYVANLPPPQGLRWRLPKVVLVLDYSKSMQWDFLDAAAGNKQAAIEVLRSSTRSFLTVDTIEYGASLFSTSLLRHQDLPFTYDTMMDEATAQANRQASNIAVGNALSENLKEWTDPASGLKKAREMFDTIRAVDPTWDTGFYVMLVSDGEPCKPPGKSNCGTTSAAAVAMSTEARALRDMNVQIRTIYIPRQARLAGTSDTAQRTQLTSFLKTSITSASPNCCPKGLCGLCFWEARDADALRLALENEANILCQVGPVDPILLDSIGMRVFLRDASNNERRLNEVASDLAKEAGEVFTYVPANGTIRLSSSACDAIVDNNETLVMRSGAIRVRE